MAPVVAKLEQSVAERKLPHSGHPILNMYAVVAVAQTDPVGTRKLHKEKGYSKIDGLVALDMTPGCMSTEDTTQQSSTWDN